LFSIVKGRVKILKDAPGDVRKRGQRPLHAWGKR
jgi:hypothetical protein